MPLHITRLVYTCADEDDELPSFLYKYVEEEEKLGLHIEEDIEEDDSEDVSEEDNSEIDEYWLSRLSVTRAKTQMHTQKHAAVSHNKITPN